MLKSPDLKGFPNLFFSHRLKRLPFRNRKTNNNCAWLRPQWYIYKIYKTIYTHKYLSIYVCTYISLYIYIYIFICTCISIYIYVYIHNKSRVGWKSYPQWWIRDTKKKQKTFFITGIPIHQPVNLDGFLTCFFCCFRGSFWVSNVQFVFNVFCENNFLYCTEYETWKHTIPEDPWDWHIYLYIYYKSHPNAGKYTIHGSYGHDTWGPE